MKRRPTIELCSLFSILIAIIGLSCAASAMAGGDKVPSSTSTAERLYNGPKLNWTRGQYVGVCERDTGKCKRVKMPKTLGKVERIFAGPMIERAEASWIALSKFESFICAIVQNTKVVCARIPERPFPAEYLDLHVKLTPQGRPWISAVPNNVGVSSATSADISKRFNRAFKETATVLQGEVDAAISPSYQFATTMSVCDSGDDPKPDPGPQPYPDCYLNDDGSMWECPVVGHPDPAPEPDPIPLPDPCTDACCY